MSIHQDVAVSVDSSSLRSKKTPKHNAFRYEESSLASQQNQFLKAYNQAPSANNNSFAFPPINNNSNYRTINASKLSERQPSSPTATKKKSAIQQLTERNQMLQKQVDRVEQILNRGEHRKIKRLPEIDGNVLKKQLENAYKQIKSYQVDISHRQKHYEHEGTYVEMLKKAEQTLAEREELVKKLEAEISQLKKQSNQFVKLLQDGHIKKQYANKTSRLHKEIKFFQSQLKEEEELALSDYYNSQQKNKRIFQMEQELQSSGIDQRTIAQIKQKFQKKDKDKAMPTQTNRSINSVSEDRSKKAFDDLKGEIAVLKKMQKDYAKKTSQLQNEREQAQKDFQQSKGKIQQIQKQIIKLQSLFLQMKKNIDPSKLKPLYKNGSLIESSTTQFGTGKGNPLDHRFDTVQAGVYNKKHTVVNDRPVIGKKSAHIVELTLYQNRTQFLGFEATYLIGEQLKKGNNNVLRRQNERFLKDKSVKLQEQDYFKTFECSINKQNIIIGFLAVSFKGKMIKAGLQQGFKKQLDIKGKQFPCCLYGSYSNNGFEMMGIQKVESQ